jgi:hypothetical protein
MYHLSWIWDWKTGQKFVRFNREFIKTGVVYVSYKDLGLKNWTKFVRYNRWSINHIWLY